MMSLILVLAAWSAGPEAAPERSARPAAVCTVRAVGGPGGVAVSRREPSYSATSILSVRFRAKARLRRSARGSESEGAVPSLRLKVYAPNGDLYDVLDASSLNGRRVRRRLLRGQARLPVAGSSIIHTSLYGRWSVVPFLAGEDTPCGRARSFSIEP